MSDATSLRERLRLDQRRRWEAGEQPRVEEYLAAHPVLAGDPENALELIYHEVCLREARDERPELDEYIERFPAFAGPLRDQFDVHRYLESGSQAPDAAGRPTRVADPYEVTVSLDRCLNWTAWSPATPGPK